MTPLDADAPRPDAPGPNEIAGRHARVTALFLAALDAGAAAQPPDDRAAWLRAACDDEAVRSEVAALLDQHVADGLLDEPWLTRPDLDAPIEGVPAAADPGQGTRLGPWRLEERLGQGGMGVVYRAARADGLYERTVAVKLLAPGYRLGDDDTLARRFAAERQILARLEHAGIARLYDGGVTDDGLPYLALELVDGVPITAYADRHGLDAEARVALFAQACDAVAYAHRRLVVHRDLKPDHIRVTPEGQVKLLDFGVSALLPDPAEATAPKLTVPRALTPAYAAPEQLRHEAVTTATDVYALGVVLYELLAGQRPYDLTGKTAAEIERLVVEAEPPPPSAVAPPARGRPLRGDLDTIAAKALAKEPERRYASARDLAADLRRHLAGHPVEARPPTAGYRAGRFVRRHRWGVAATALVALALVVGAGLALWQARVARAEAARAEAVNVFLVDLLGSASPHQAGRDVRVASLLDQAAASLDSSFAGQPALEAEARHTLGLTYRELGLYAEAVAQFRRALALRERLYGPRHLDVADTQHNLGVALQNLTDFAAADSLYRRALATAQTRAGRDSRMVSILLNDLGYLHNELGDLAAAEDYYRRSLAIDARTLPADHLDLLIGYGNLGVVLADQGKNDAAAGQLERQVEGLRRAHPEKAEWLGNALSNLGTVRYAQGRGEEAAALQAEAVALFRRVLGDDHDYVAFALSNLGSTLSSLERYDEAEPVLREAAAIYTAALGADHPDVGFPLVNLAKAFYNQGRLDEAEATIRRAAALFRDGFGPEHFTVARALGVQGEVLMAQGRAAEAAASFREALAVQQAVLPEGHPDRATTASLLGTALAATGQPGEAEPLLRQGYDALRDDLGPEHARTRQARERLRTFYEATGQADLAAAL